MSHDLEGSGGVNLLDDRQKFSIVGFTFFPFCTVVTRFVRHSLIFTSIFLCSALAHAQADLNLGASFRSYPLSAVFEPEVGYGLVFWGTSGRSPWYGYLRPNVSASSAGTYNSWAGSLEFFPVSFLGVRAGGEEVQNDSEYSAYDCELYRCLGRFHRTHVDVELNLGLGPVFAQGLWRRERWSQKKEQTGDFIDPTSGLVMGSSGEMATVWLGLVGVKLTSNFNVLGGLRYAEGDEVDTHSRMAFGLIRYRLNQVIIGLGGGEFESELKNKEFTVLANLRWEIWPSVEIH